MTSPCIYKADVFFLSRHFEKSHPWRTSNNRGEGNDENKKMRVRSRPYGARNRFTLDVLTAYVINRNKDGMRMLIIARLCYSSKNKNQTNNC